MLSLWHIEVIIRAESVVKIVLETTLLIVI